MADLKPIGSEKLQGDEKLKRILELTYYNSNKGGKKKSSEIIKETKTGVYGIVKEKDGYYVKRGLTEETLDYIGGLFMKKKNRFNSYGDALKRMELLSGQEQLNEATKYVLKKNNPEPQSEAPVASPTTDIPPVETQGQTPIPQSEIPAPEGEIPTEPESEIPVPEDEMGDEESSEGDYLKIIQKLSGRLGQKLRDFAEKLEGDDIKYVINMVLSAVDLDKLELEDKEEIISKFEDEEIPTDEMGNDEISNDEEIPQPEEEDELGENIDQLEELINTPFDDDDYEYPDDEENPDDDVLNKEFDDKLFSGDLEDTEEYKFDGEFDLNEDPENVDDVKELDIDELTNLVNTSVKETLGKYFE